VVSSELSLQEAGASCRLSYFSLGVSGTWIGTFTQLAPYQPYLVGVTIICLGLGYWLVYRSSKSPHASKARRVRGHCRIGSSGLGSLSRRYLRDEVINLYDLTIPTKATMFAYPTGASDIVHML
jgi:hypothetical protein